MHVITKLLFEIIWGLTMMRKQICFLMLILMVLPSISNVNNYSTNPIHQENMSNNLENSLELFDGKNDNYFTKIQADAASTGNRKNYVTAENLNEPDSFYLTSDELNNKIDDIYNLKEKYQRNTLLYDKEYTSAFPYSDTNIGNNVQQTQTLTDIIIVKFSSMEEQMKFINKIPDRDLIYKSQLIPYISIRASESAYTVLKNSLGVVDIYDDVLTPLPEYKISDLKSMNQYNVSFYNSEAHIGAPQLHDWGITGRGVKVAVLDTGIDDTHHDLQVTSQGKQKIIGEASFVDYNFDGIPDEGPEDLIGHGTHVTGTVAGNGYQIGVAPDAYILNGKVCGSIGCATTWMMEAMEWAYNKKADVITMSIGGSTVYGQDPLDALIDEIWQKGVVITIAAGNAGPSLSTVQSPGTNPHVLTVGATDIYDKVTAFSGRGPSVYGHPDPDIVAPGLNIFSTIPVNSYDIYSGTSMATPHVAGAVALLKQKFPYANPDMIKANLMRNAKDLGQSTNEQGMGLVDLQKTVKNWNMDSSILFPEFTEADVLYLSPGETFSGYLEFLSGISPRPSPHFAISKEYDGLLNIDTSDHNFFLRQKYYPYTITIPSNSKPGNTITIPFVVWWQNTRAIGRNQFFFGNDFVDDVLLHPHKYPYYSAYLNRFITKLHIQIQIQVIDYQNDAGTNTDAGDTVLGATSIEFGNYTAFANDIDFYNVYLEKGEQYTFVLDGMSGYSDFDLFIYNNTGYLACDVCNIGLYGTAPEYISLTSEYDGYYSIRIDPFSVLYNDPYTRIDSSGPYSLTMVYGGIANGGNDGSGTQLNYISSNIYGVDKNGDSIYDLLAIDVTFDVVQPGLLDAYVWLALDKGLPLPRTTYTMAYLEMIQFDTTGVQTLTFYVDGTIVADQHFNGPHVIYELFYGDPNTFTILGDLYNVYTSPALDSNDFGPKHIDYQGFEIETVDENNDGISDWLIVNTSIEIFRTFAVSPVLFTGVLWHPNGYYLYSSNMPELIITESGHQYLIFVFNPNDFIGDNPELLDLEFTLFYSDNHPLVTSTMHYGIFPYAIMVNENFVIDTTEFFGPTSSFGDKILEIEDYGADTNQNGKFDRLVFEITIQIENPGYYSLSMHPYLWSVRDQKVSFHYDTYASIDWYDSGTYTLQISTSGEIINANKLNGPFLVLFFWLDKFQYDPTYGYYFPIGTSDYFQNYLTKRYRYCDFDTTGLKFNKIVGLNYVDMNGDSEAETLELMVEFDVGRQGTYNIYMNLIDYPLGYFFNSNSYFAFTFTETGTQQLSILIGGEDFYNNKILGYVEIFTLEIYSQQENFFSYQNGIFWVDYNLLPGARPSGAISDMKDYGEDLDSNGLFEYLVLEIKVDVYKPDSFNIYSLVYADPSTGYNTFIGYYYKSFSAVESGIITIDIEIPAKDIITNSIEYYTNFEIWLYLMDGMGYQIDNKGPLYTNYYYLDQFEYTVPVYEWFTNFKELDADNDNLIDMVELGSDFHSIDLINAQIDVMMEVYFIDESQETLVNAFIQSTYVTLPDSWYYMYFEYLASYSGNYHIITNLFIDGALMQTVEIYWLDVDKFDLPTYSVEANLLTTNWDTEVTDDTVLVTSKLHVFDNPGIVQMNYYIYLLIYKYNEQFGTWDFFDYDYDSYYSFFYGDRVHTDYFYWNAKESGMYQFDVILELYGQQVYSFSETAELTQFTQPFSYFYTWYNMYYDEDYDGLADTIQFSYNAFIDPQMNIFDNLIFTMDIFSYDPATESKTYVDSQIIVFDGPVYNAYWADFFWPVIADGYYYYDVNVSIGPWKVDEIGLSTPYLTEKKELDFTWSLNYYGTDSDGDSLEDTININIDFSFSESANYKVEIYVEIYFINPDTGEMTYIDTLQDNFMVENGNPSNQEVNFEWQATSEGQYFFSVAMIFNGQIFQYEYFSWIGYPITSP